MTTQAHYTVWKFDLPSIGERQLRMPRGARPLTVQVQHGAPKLWAAVNAHAGWVDRTVSVVGTGKRTRVEVVTDALYVGTFQLEDGDHVGHVFLFGEPPS